MNRRTLKFTLLLGLVLMLMLAIGSVASADSGDVGAQSRPGPINGPVVGEAAPLEVQPGFDAKFQLDTAGAKEMVAELGAQAAAAYGVGDERIFLISDNYFGRYRTARYTVRYIGDNVEIWVQNDLRYRNPDQTINPIHPEASHPQYITPDRIQYLANVFENVVRPTDVSFSGPYNDRSGADAVLPGLIGLPADYYVTDNPQRLIILVSNVRDDNYYDPIHNPTRIVGFVSTTLNTYADRNTFTLDSSQWNVFMGAPRYLSEAVLAHEFTHLIATDSPGSTQSSGGASWMEEGLAEFSEFYTGYRASPEEWRTQFADYPENSLTLWGDQNGDPDSAGVELNGDYNLANLFFHYLAGRLKEAGLGAGPDGYLRLVADLNKSDLYGIDAVNEMLTAAGAPFDFEQVWSDFRVAMLHNGTSDTTSWGSYISPYQAPSGVPIAAIDVARLRRNYNFEGYDTPGAPPYGADYIQIGWSEAILPDTKLTLDGDTDLALPTDWSVVPFDDVGVPAEGGPGGNVLYSGHTDLADNFLIFPVTVPAEGGMLEFDTLYNIEIAWDYGFVQATTDTAGGTGFTSLPIDGTMSDLDPAAHPVIKANVPGFSGVSGSEDEPAWAHKSYDLAAYAGKDILLAFRYATDWGSAGTVEAPVPGWYLDNVKVGGVALFTDEDAVPANGKSIWQVRRPKYGFMFDVVSFADGNGDVAAVHSAPVDDTGAATFDLGAMLSDPGFDGAGESVMALVSSIPPAAPTDLVSMPTIYPRYSLTGLPPSLYSTRVRMVGSGNDSTTTSPRVYPGNTFDVTVTMDDLARSGDSTAAETMAYVAMELPAGATYVNGSASASVSPENISYAADLSAVDAGLPAAPGVYWHGAVTGLADLKATFSVPTPHAFCTVSPDDCPLDTFYRPLVHVANAAFSANPSQHFDSLGAPRFAMERRDKLVTVVSPLALSVAAGPASVTEGQTASWTYTLINTDNKPRELDFGFTVPAGASLAGLQVNNQGVAGASADAASVVNLRLTVPSTVATGLGTVVKFDIFVPMDFPSATLNPQPTILQPGSDKAYASLPVANTSVVRVPRTTELKLMADTWVNGGDMMANYNAYQALVARSTGVDNALLVWDVSGLPANAQIQSAQMTVNVSLVSGFQKSLFALNVGGFNPATVKFADKLSYSNPGAGAAAVVGPVTLDVTSQTARMLTEAMNGMGYLAIGASGYPGRVSMDSLDSSPTGKPAKLVVTWVPAP